VERRGNANLWSELVTLGGGDPEIGMGAPSAGGVC